MSHTPTDITILLRAAATGDRTDLDALMHALYDDMRRLAVSHLAAERPDHTLQPTALVHEAYLKLVDQRSTDWNDRLHFFAVAARVIRRILIDHARERNALKRGGADRPVRLTDHDAPGAERGVDLVALDEALADLAQIDERQARVVELKFFAGCGIDEIAELLGVGRRTVDRDWMAARAWLFDRLAEPDGRPGDRDDGR